MKRFGLAMLAGMLGYVAGAIAGYFLINSFSGNPHDRSVEAAMTSVFLTGPVGAIVGFAAGMIYFRDKSRTR